MADLLQASIPLTLTLEEEQRESLSDFLAYEATSADPTAITLSIDEILSDENEELDEDDEDTSTER
ncbi:hypothetical protein [Plantibacter sp. ME-Dv--P-095]|uniref:hypothetical protein n=1 Tax=Plantibacter sp. ME-Dv--P-095 TaxID=3040299 RepID=UPI00254CA088|nr:hypothetical protein [Plantibacter sp. ME-Dv--P-095]